MILNPKTVEILVLSKWILNPTISVLKLALLECSQTPASGTSYLQQLVSASRPTAALISLDCGGVSGIIVGETVGGGKIIERYDLPGVMTLKG